MFGGPSETGCDSLAVFLVIGVKLAAEVIVWMASVIVLKGLWVLYSRFSFYINNGFMI